MNDGDKHMIDIFKAMTKFFGKNDPSLHQEFKNVIDNWFNYKVGLPEGRVRLAGFSRDLGIKVPDKWEK